VSPGALLLEAVDLGLPDRCADEGLQRDDALFQQVDARLIEVNGFLQEIVEQGDQFHETIPFLTRR
jgi:hypothetical protein